MQIKTYKKLILSENYWKMTKFLGLNLLDLISSIYQDWKPIKN